MRSAMSRRFVPRAGRHCHDELGDGSKRFLGGIGGSVDRNAQRAAISSRGRSQQREHRMLTAALLTGGQKLVSPMLTQTADRGGGS
jgi:hypothetical protein